MNSIEIILGAAFGKLPPLPANVKGTAAKFIPWLIIGLGSFGLLAWLGSLQFFFALSGFSHPAFPSSVILSLITAPVIQGMAICGGYFMLKRRSVGWRLAFYSLLVGAVVSLLSFTPIGLLLNAIFAYFLFQIKEFFTE